MKSKILFFLHLPPPVHGSSLVGLNIKGSTAINKSFECTYINLLASQNVAESGQINFRKIFGFVFTIFHLFGNLFWNRPKLCYLALTTTGLAFYKDVMLIAIIRLFRIKRVYHLHNKGISSHQNNIINQICYNFVFGGTDVILLSKYLYPDIQKFVKEEKVHICPNGIADHELESKEHAANVTVRILFLSNLIVTKGVFVLIEAMALLKQKKIIFEGVFIGGEGDVTASQFNEIVNQFGLNGRVSYQGKKYGEEKNQGFSKADIFAFPTYYSNECFPLVLLEAMSYSLPLVSTFEGGIPDIIEDSVTGFLVKQKDVVSLAEKLELLIQNKELRHQMGAAGRKKYENEFTLDKFEGRLTEILHQVIETR